MATIGQLSRRQPSKRSGSGRAEGKLQRRSHSMAQVDIESVLKEERVFTPPKEFSAKAHIKSFQDYEKLYKQAQDDPEGFWAGMARELDWFTPWEKVLEWNPPFAKWFIGG